MAAILANPHYTGRQVWNRQRTDADLVDPGNTGLQQARTREATGGAGRVDGVGGTR